MIVTVGMSAKHMVVGLIPTGGSINKIVCFL